MARSLLQPSPHPRPRAEFRPREQSALISIPYTAQREELRDHSACGSHSTWVNQMRLCCTALAFWVAALLSILSLLLCQVHLLDKPIEWGIQWTLMWLVIYSFPFAGLYGLVIWPFAASNSNSGPSPWASAGLGVLSALLLWLENFAEGGCFLLAGVVGPLLGGVMLTLRTASEGGASSSSMGDQRP